MRRTFRPGEQCASHQPDGWFGALIQHRITERREFLASRNALHLDRFRSEPSRSRGRELHDSEMGWDEGED